MKLLAVAVVTFLDLPDAVLLLRGEGGLPRLVQGPPEGPNDRDFEVALHIVFKDKASHDRYQDAETHRKFIEENKDNWKKVRVFDSYVEPAGGK